MKRIFLLFAVLASLSAHVVACSDDDTEEPTEHGHDGGDDHDGG